MLRFENCIHRGRQVARVPKPYLCVADFGLLSRTAALFGLLPLNPTL